MKKQTKLCRPLCRRLDQLSRLGYTRDMKQDDKRRGQSGNDGRDARLKAALKANLARRKAQARARQDAAEPAAQDNGDTPGEE